MVYLVEANPPSKLIPPFMHPGRAAYRPHQYYRVVPLAMDVRDHDSSVSIKSNKSLDSDSNT